MQCETIDHIYMGEHYDLKPKNVTKKVDNRDYIKQKKERNVSTEKEFKVCI
jgi:hypothetical protein